MTDSKDGNNDMSSKPSLARFFEPQSVAVLGASADPSKAGNTFAKTLLEGGYEGDVYLVNRRGVDILGRPSYRSLEEVPGSVDVLLSLLSPDDTVAALTAAGDRGDGFAIVYSAGFAEAGAGGLGAQEALNHVTESTDLRILGPNCMGSFNTKNGLDLTGIGEIPAGKTGLISQSGNVAISLISQARGLGLGFSKFAGIGNQSDLTVSDFLDFLAQDTETDSILLYVESIKTEDAERFKRSLTYACRRKPVVVLKGGVTPDGQRASESHTAGLAGSARIFSAVIHQAGATEVTGLEDMFPAVQALTSSPPLKGSRIAVIGSGGGHAILAADALSRLGLQVPVFAAETQQRIADRLPAWAPVQNPVDMAGAFMDDLALFVDIVQDALQDPAPPDGVLLFGLYGRWGGAEMKDRSGQTYTSMAEQIGHLQREIGRPVVMYSPYAGEDLPSFAVLRSAGIPCFDSLPTAAGALRSLLQKPTRKRDDSPTGNTSALVATDDSAIPRGANADLFSSARQRPHSNLTESEAYALLAQYDIPSVEHRLCNTSDELSMAANDLGFPLVAKAGTANLVHKSDVGAVMTGLNDVDSLLDAAALIRTRVEAETGEGTKILVAQQLPTKVEVIVGAMRDSTFGPTVVVGFGGVFAEILDDVATLPAPFSRDDYDAAIQGLKGRSLLTGARGTTPVDDEKLWAIVHGLAELMLDNPDIAQVDLNPVLIDNGNPSCVDARVLLSSINNVNEPTEVML